MLPATVVDSAKLDVKMDGEIVAKYCNKCKRYTIKNGGHYLFEHTSSRSMASTNKGGSSVVSATTSLAAIEEHPAMMQCKIPDYDTPALVHELHGVTDDCSVDSCAHAFLLLAPHPWLPLQFPTL